MIPFNDVIAWRRIAPWPNIDYVEQDLILSRALVEIYQDELVREKVAFRGGTALNKLYFDPPARFSEDIDLVQMKAEPIGPVLDALRARLDPWLGEPRRQLKEGRAVLNYRYQTEEKKTKVKLKVEINTREHTPLYGYEKKKVVVKNPWFSGSAEVTTYCLEELIGTKIRALYQRKKGRDLFDLWFTKSNCTLDWTKAATAFRHYLKEQGVSVSVAEFNENIRHKLKDESFLSDITVLKKPDLDYPTGENALVLEALIQVLS